jgi:integrase
LLEKHTLSRLLKLSLAFAPSLPYVQICAPICTHRKTYPMVFTARWLDALKAKSNKPEEHFEPDPNYRGLAIRVAPSGRKTFTFHFTFAKRRCRMDFGTYPATSLKEAHHRALDYRRALESQPPIDPRAIKAGTSAAPADVATVDGLIKAYVGDLRLAAQPLRTLDEIEQMLTNHVGRHIGTLPLVGVNRLVLKGLIDRPRARQAHSMAREIHKRLRVMFEWGFKFGWLESNPMAGMDAPEEGEVKENARPLSPPEVRTFWHGVADVLSDYCREPFTRIFKLLLLTGCRLGEVAELDVAEIAGDVWTVPKERAKNGVAHPIPLNDDMRAIIGEAKSGSPWGEANGLPIVARRVSDAFFKADVPAALGLADFTIHGLRRTVASQMDEMGIPESTIALCLNHHYGPSKKSVTRGYIKPSAEVFRARELAKLKLRRDALDQWADRLREIVS